MPTAEQCFSKGLAALAGDCPAEAARYFDLAMQVNRRSGSGRPDLRYLSYYGLSLARSNGITEAALQACELSVAKDPGQPLLWLNLGRVHLVAGQISQALSCFERGLRLAPNDIALCRELEHRDRRARPVVSLLPRSHPLNRWAGRVRAHWWVAEPARPSFPSSPSSPQP